MIGTGSSGNAYILTHQETGESILLDAGMNQAKIHDAIYRNNAKVMGCLVTHEHGDHSSAVKDLVRNGIRCYGTPGTNKVVGGMQPISPYDPNLPMDAQDIKTIGPFLVMAFRTNHDASEPCGFLITNFMTGERMVYATDTYYIAYKFPGIHYWLIECNYCDDLLMDSDTAPMLARRLNQSHMSLQRVCQLFQANDLTACRQIILCHMSHERGDPERMIREVRGVAHKPVAVAQAGDVYLLNLKPF